MSLYAEWLSLTLILLTPYKEADDSQLWPEAEVENHLIRISCSKRATLSNMVRRRSRLRNSKAETIVAA